MSVNKSVLAIVDMQNGFVTHHSQHVISVIKTLAEEWMSAGGEVLFTRYLNYPDSPFERLIHWTKLQDSPSIDIVDELAPIAGKSITLDKRIYSVFNQEGERLVRDKEWDNIVVCGIATESCVLKTAVDAFERDLTPWVVTDACASHAGTGPHEAGLLVASRFIGRGQLIDAATVRSRFLSGPADQPIVGPDC